MRRSSGAEGGLYPIFWGGHTMCPLFLTGIVIYHNLIEITVELNFIPHVFKCDQSQCR